MSVYSISYLIFFYRFVQNLVLTTIHWNQSASHISVISYTEAPVSRGAREIVELERH
jgi:hypothetical protein